MLSKLYDKLQEALAPSQAMPGIEEEAEALEHHKRLVAELEAAIEQVGARIAQCYDAERDLESRGKLMSSTEDEERGKATGRSTGVVACNKREQ